MSSSNSDYPQMQASPEFTIRENQIPGTYFGRVDTTDRDQQKVAFYFIVGKLVTSSRRFLILRHACYYSGGTHGNIIGIEPDSGNLFLRTNVVSFKTTSGPVKSHCFQSLTLFSLLFHCTQDYDGGQTLLSAVIAAVSTNSNPGVSYGYSHTIYDNYVSTLLCFYSNLSFVRFGYPSFNDSHLAIVSYKNMHDY